MEWCPTARRYRSWLAVTSELARRVMAVLRSEVGTTVVSSSLRWRAWRRSAAAIALRVIGLVLPGEARMGRAARSVELSLSILLRIAHPWRSVGMQRWHHVTSPSDGSARWQVFIRPGMSRGSSWYLRECGRRSTMLQVVVRSSDMGRVCHLLWRKMRNVTIDHVSRWLLYSSQPSPTRSIHPRRKAMATYSGVVQQCSKPSLIQAVSMRCLSGR